MKILKILTFSALVLIFFNSALFAQERCDSQGPKKKLPPQTYELIIDNYFSPYTGADLMMSTFNVYKLLDDRFIPSSEGKGSFLWATARASKVLFLDLPISTFLLVTQHEIFGHGYRLREFHVRNISYQVRFFSGYTSFSEAEFDRLSLPQKAAASAGGMEATTILAYQQRQKWIMRDKIDHRDAVLYIFSTMDQYDYVHGTESLDGNSSNDVQSYINQVNNWYGQQTLTLANMRARTTWDLVDPALWYSFYAVGKYVCDSDPTIPFYMFNIKGYKYLPNTRSLLAPYGMEVQLQNHLKTPANQLVEVYLRYGSNQNITSYGLDFFVKPIWTYKKFAFGNRLFLWRQPNLSASTAQTANNKYGIAEYLNCVYKVNKDFAIISELGYKTPGYIQGEPLTASVIGRLGFRYKAFNK